MLNANVPLPIILEGDYAEFRKLVEGLPRSYLEWLALLRKTTDEGVVRDLSPSQNAISPADFHNFWASHGRGRTPTVAALWRCAVDAAARAYGATGLPADDGSPEYTARLR
jgi:hypothetical protein